MRDKAPFKENFDKWFAVPNNMAFIGCNGFDLCRVKQFSEFGLNKKWYENAKNEYSNYKIAMRKIGKAASYQHTVFWT